MESSLSPPNIKLQNSEFILLRDFIAEHFGIFFEDRNQWQLESKLRNLMQKRRDQTFLEYYQHLVQTFYIRQSYEDGEFIALINAVTNNETYFYREPEALDTMVKALIPDHLSRNQKNLNILSAACSSGEEAYTIAMILKEYNLPADVRIKIWGIDIDPGMIEKASRGIYQANSFRNTYQDVYQQRFNQYFNSDSNKTNYVLKTPIRSMVQFRNMNLLNLPQLKTLGLFDVIFCRNVLIYFSAQARAAAIRNFAEILNPKGHLFLGHSEIIFDDCFKTVEENNYVFYEKQGSS